MEDNCRKSGFSLYSRSTLENQYIAEYTIPLPSFHSSCSFPVYRKEILKKAAYFTGVLAFTFFLAIPASLYISSRFSENYSKPVREEFDLKMAEFKSEYEAKVELMKEAELLLIEGNLFDSPGIISPKFLVMKSVLSDAGEITRELPDVLLRTGVSWLLDIIIVPIGLLFPLFKLALLLTESVFGSLRAEKLEKTLKKHLKQSRRVEE